MNTLSLKAISHDEVLVQNVLLGTARDIEFRVGNAQYALTFYTPEFSPEPALTFSLQVGEHLLGIELEAIPPLVLDGADFPSAEYELMPPEVAQVVFGAFLQPYISGLSAFFNTEVRLHSIGPLPGGLDRSFGATLSQNGNAAWARAHVHAPGALWGSIAHKLQSIAPQPVEDYSSLPFTARLQVGASQMSFEKLQELELQDILLFDQGLTPRLARCVVHFADVVSFNAEIKDNSIILQSIMNESTPSEDIPPSSGAGASPSLDAFTLRLTFEVGEKDIPAGDLQSLQAGYTFEMDSPLDCPVSIKVNGRKIGTGELVQVADRMGVRVLDFSQERPVMPKKSPAPAPEPAVSEPEPKAVVPEQKEEAPVEPEASPEAPEEASPEEDTHNA